ncbi:MAG: hypothetical protein M5U31_13520 [Acidimicrobiia bacterium]|nr:hypothetical protein [Acidimicrobiia bacterium]
MLFGEIHLMVQLVQLLGVLGADLAHLCALLRRTGMSEDFSGLAEGRDRGDTLTEKGNARGEIEPPVDELHRSGLRDDGFGHLDPLHLGHGCLDRGTLGSTRLASRPQCFTFVVGRAVGRTELRELLFPFSVSLLGLLPVAVGVGPGHGDLDAAHVARVLRPPAVHRAVGCSQIVGAEAYDADVSCRDSGIE